MADRFEDLAADVASDINSDLGNGHPVDPSIVAAALRTAVADAYRDAAEVARWSAATHWHSAKISEEAGERGAYLLARGRAQGHEMASDAIEARAKEVLGSAGHLLDGLVHGEMPKR